MSDFHSMQTITDHCHLGRINYLPSLSYQDLKEATHTHSHLFQMTPFHRGKRCNSFQSFSPFTKVYKNLVQPQCFPTCGLLEMTVSQPTVSITLNLLRACIARGTMQKDWVGDQDQGLKQDEIIKGAEATVVLIIDNNLFIQISRLATYRQTTYYLH